MAHWTLEGMGKTGKPATEPGNTAIVENGPMFLKFPVSENVPGNFLKIIEFFWHLAALQPRNWQHCKFQKFFYNSETADRFDPLDGP